jgi:hypothetical protein
VVVAVEGEATATSASAAPEISAAHCRERTARSLLIFLKGEWTGPFDPRRVLRSQVQDQLAGLGLPASVIILCCSRQVCHGQRSTKLARRPESVRGIPRRITRGGVRITATHRGPQGADVQAALGWGGD